MQLQLRYAVFSTDRLRSHSSQIVRCSVGACSHALKKHRGTISSHQQQLVKAVVLCQVTIGQTNNPRQAALAVLNQLLQIEHDLLALDTDGQGSQCMDCGTAVYICAWKGKADPWLRRNMWCMMCKNAESTELVRLLSKDSIMTAIKLLSCIPGLQKKVLESSGLW